MISEDKAHEFANEWIASWNAHDLNRVMSHTDLFPHSVTFGFEFDPSQLEKAAKVDWIRLNGAEQHL